jgi:hypothetical protein
MNLKPDDTVYIPILKKSVLITTLHDEFKMYKKANVLQYHHKHHTNKLTKNQTYALIAKGKWLTRKTYATQSETYTNPNKNYLKRVNYDVINAETGAQTTEPITCPSYIPKTYANTLPPNNNTPSVIPAILPGPPPTPSKNKFTIPDIIPIVNNAKHLNIPDGGNLIIGTISDICSGKTIITCFENPIVCFPSSCSNVPTENGEDKELCFTKGSPSFLTSNKISTATSHQGGQYTR